MSLCAEQGRLPSYADPIRTQRDICCMSWRIAGLVPLPQLMRAPMPMWHSSAHPVRTRSDHCSMSWRDRDGSVVTVCVTSLEGSMSP